MRKQKAEKEEDLKKPLQLMLDDEDRQDVETLKLDERRRHKDKSIGGATVVKRYGMPAIRAELVRRGLPLAAPQDPPKSDRRSGQSERRSVPAGVTA